jgi:hypothetical protein
MSKSLLVAAAALLVVGAGFPLAFALFRRVAFGLLLAPLISALTASAAVVSMTIVGGPFWLWITLALVANFGLAGFLFVKKLEPLALAGVKDVLWLTVPLIPPFLMVLNLPTALWDSHVFWWMRGGIYLRGAEFTRDSFTNDVHLYTHPDYPPGSSATVAGVWSVVPGFDLHVAQFVSALLSFSAIGTLAYAVTAVAHRAKPWLRRAVALFVVIPVWTFNPEEIAGGYNDALWSASFAAAALLIFVGDRWRGQLLLPVILLCAATLAKNEGLMAATVLAVLVLIKHRRSWREAWPVAIPIAVSVTWVLTGKAFGATSDLTGENFGERVTDVAMLASRVRPLLAHTWHTIGHFIVVGALVAVLGLLLLRKQRKELELGSDLWLWAVFAAYSAVIGAVYLITPYDLAWHLFTSFDRVILLLLLLIQASVGLWVATALTPVGGADSPPRSAWIEATPRRSHEPVDA